jgi:hypothetical protein
LPSQSLDHDERWIVAVVVLVVKPLLGSRLPCQWAQIERWRLAFFALILSRVEPSLIMTGSPIM